MSENKDRISKYLIEANKGIIFDELKDDYLKKAGVQDILSGIPVPLIFDEEGMSNLTIAYGMARVVGGDNSFIYAKQYLEYIKRIMGDVAVKVLVSEGAKYASEDCFEIAAMFFRTCLMIDPRSLDALYLYGRACKDAYEDGSQREKDEKYVGLFKAESLEIFELLTMIHPRFAMGYYFLGYGYLNLGLYTKAKITWQTFMKLIDEDGAESAGVDNGAEIVSGAAALDRDKLKTEIQERLNALEEPVRIEYACNLVMGGYYQQGREILEEYTEGHYDKWWPLWYYLGIAKSAMMDAEGAIEAFKKVLVLSPSNTQVMQELAEVYDAIGDEVNREKYLNKIELIKKTS